MESLPRRTDGVLADNVLLKLQHLVLRGAYLPYTEEITWSNVPLLLAERAFYLSGLPAVCQPVVQDDKVQDDPRSWPLEKLQTLDKALNEGSVKVLFREPISRRVIFELVEPDGTMRDSTLGFSPRWCFDHLFAEKTYGSITIEMLKMLNGQTLMSILSSVKGLKIPQGHLPWISLPPKLWQAGYYITGVPRTCVPVAVDDKIPSSAPSLGAKFRKDQRLLLQRAIDSGLVAVLERPPAYPPHVTPDVNSVVEYYKALLVPCGLLLDTPIGPAWNCLPQMLATKRLIILGLPRICIPVVQNDIVADNFDPFVWSSAAHIAFLKVACRHRVYVAPRPPGQRILYRVLEENGVLTADTLGFSEDWCKEYLDPLDLTSPTIAPGVYVIGMWLDMLESVNIPCHDNLGRRHIQWAYLPTFLAHRGLCITGCPRECIPRVDNDMVLEISSPYYYDGMRLAAMHKAFTQRKVSIRPRAEGENAFFYGSENGRSWESTCGFSENWVQKTIRPFPGGAINYVPVPPMTIQRPIVPLQIQMPGPIASQNVSRLPTPVDTPLREKGPKATSDPPASTPVSVLTSTSTSTSTPKPVAPITPESSAASRGSVDSSDSVSSPTPMPKIKEEPSVSLKIIIPPFKRRATAAAAIKPPENPVSANKPIVSTAAEVNTATVLPSRAVPSAAASSSAALATITPSPTPPRVDGPPRSFHPSSGLVVFPAAMPPPLFAWGPLPQVQPVSTLPTHLLTSKRPVIKVSYSSPRRRNKIKQVVATHSPPAVSDPSDDEPSENYAVIRRIGPRGSLSPPLPPSHTLPNPLPDISPPTFLPKPGGNLRWDEERKRWELTVSEAFPPSEWQRLLPVYPSRVLWNPALQIWCCEPSMELTWPPKEDKIGLSKEVRADLVSSKRDGPLPVLEPGLCIIWHRWRRTWGLFQFDPQRQPKIVSSSSS
ncbi:hypothetical protein FRC16_004867 [Serendipita sp. 398]|nr:hypothetical protein FRC16_004867 [Serendipita sp. 398]